MSGEPKASPSADTTILFVKGEGKCPVPIYHFLYCAYSLLVKAMRLLKGLTVETGTVSAD